MAKNDIDDIFASSKKVKIPAGTGPVEEPTAKSKSKGIEKKEAKSGKNGAKKPPSTAPTPSRMLDDSLFTDLRGSKRRKLEAHTSSTVTVHLSDTS